MNSLFRKWRQWLANRSVTIEFRGQVEGILVQNELRRIESKLTARIDVLEGYVDDVIEKYLRKVTARENRARQKEEPMVVEPTTGFDIIRQKYGGRE